jgi:hypothetical protein
MNSLIVRICIIYSTRHKSPDIDSGKSPSQWKILSQCYKRYIKSFSNIKNYWKVCGILNQLDSDSHQLFTKKWSEPTDSEIHKAADGVMIHLCCVSKVEKYEPQKRNIVLMHHFCTCMVTLGFWNCLSRHTRIWDHVSSRQARVQEVRPAFL